MRFDTRHRQREVMERHRAWAEAKAAWERIRDDVLYQVQVVVPEVELLDKHFGI